MFIQKPFKELPFPGIYVLDEDGQVIEKFFNRSFAIRSSAGNILNSALGEILLPEDDPAVDFINDQIEFTAFLADPELQLEYVALFMYALRLPRVCISMLAHFPEGLLRPLSRWPTELA